MDKGFMVMNLRITSILVLCVSACLVIPKIADARGTLSDLVANGLTHSDGNRVTTSNVNSQELTDIYVPPNYGVPDSQHGSGTR
ncbi:hypothetical protein NIES2109_51140 [Nostoc sp. HK-01]|uniref:Uncharacterized protein n=2 Tax=Nostocales TaxID=1161 RepID=A0A1Z4GNN0_9CYAN|nr:hypothetical protein [Nostoc cycadae]BAY19077.1 hypothetical protein NIES21_49360 [Anabaenopsis circularis NIES-21]BBD62275.1 hypothetical protein NIES2109_51140 [Nostoc sp. HK-01]GBE92811.1 two-component sensor histidine kinase [Nostoc cycadae WK-1]